MVDAGDSKSPALTGVPVRVRPWVPHLDLEWPFNEKDMCKSIGGRWDMDERKWYVPAELDPEQFRRWWPADASASKTHLTIVNKD